MKKYRSLTFRQSRMILIYSVLLGFLCLIVGLFTYLNSEMFLVMNWNHALAAECLTEISRKTDPAKYTRMVRKRYEETGFSPESDEYFEHFKGIEDEPGYKEMTDTIYSFRMEEMSDIFLAITDIERGRIIIVSDTAWPGENADPVGKQIKIPRWILNSFFDSSSKRESFNHIYNVLSYRGIIGVSGAYVDENRPEDGYLFVFVRLKDIITTVLVMIVNYIIVVLIMVVLMGIYLTHRINKNITGPVKKIAAAASDYVKDRQSGINDTGHFSEVNINTGDEIENLRDILDSMELELSAYMEERLKTATEKERINTELKTASAIQKSVLPRTFPAFPDRDEFDIYATMDPAKEVGGDFYDFFLIDNDHLCMVIADVSGKGIPAALYMMTVKATLARCAESGKSPSEILVRTNSLICTGSDAEMFVTVWLGILEISTGKLTAANAGHTYPVFKHRNGDFELFTDEHGLFIGMMDGLKFKDYRITLKKGAKLFIYTDGVSEATDPDNDLFGTERLLSSLNSAKSAAPKEILNAVENGINDFIKEAEQFDDITMLCLEYRGSSKEKET